MAKPDYRDSWDPHRRYYDNADRGAEGSIIPAFILCGMVASIMVWLTTRDLLQSGGFALLMFGTLGLWCWSNAEEVERWHPLDVVHEYGSSGSFIRFVGNLLLAVIVVGLIALASYWLVEKSFLMEHLTPAK